MGSRWLIAAIVAVNGLFVPGTRPAVLIVDTASQLGHRLFGCSQDLAMKAFATTAELGLGIVGVLAVRYFVSRLQQTGVSRMESRGCLIAAGLILIYNALAFALMLFFWINND